MRTEDIIIIAVLAIILCGAIAYMIKTKKSGKKCIGCPGGCSGSSGGCNGCRGREKDGEKTE
jgi:hypothetical protein